MKFAYPQNYGIRMPDATFDTKKWKEVAFKIAIAMRRFADHTEQEVVGHFTRDWDLQEQDHFKAWLKYQKKTAKKKDKPMRKVAYDFQSGQGDDKLSTLKKKLRSRVNSAERLLNQIMDEGLLGDDNKGLYIGRILQKLKEEISTLRRPELINARHNWAGKMLRKAGFIEGAEIVENSTKIVAEMQEKESIHFVVKTAQADVSNVMGLLKAEIDAFNYGKHLEALYQIATALREMGRHSEADDVIVIIKKDLANVDGVHKKLVDVFTRMGQIPTSPSQQEEAKSPSAPQIESPRGI